MSRQNRGGGRDGKKPSAIIDVKATEVSPAKTPEGAGAAAKAEASKSAPASGAKPAQAKPASAPSPASTTKPAPPSETAYALRAFPAAKDRKVDAAAAKPAAKPAAQTKPASTTGSAAGAKVAATAGAAATAGTARAAPGGGRPGGPGGSGSGSGGPGGTPQPRKSGGGGFLSTLTHLVAAIVGGAIVLLFGEQVAQQTGLPLPKREASVPDAFVERVAALEANVQSAGGGAATLPDDAAAKLGQVDAQASEIASLKQTLSELQSKQAELTQQAGAGGGQAGGEVPQAFEERVAKLEQTLGALSEVGSNGSGSAGGAAQITALSADVEKRFGALAQSNSEVQAGAEKLSKDVETARTEIARLSQRAEAGEAEDKRVDETLRVLKEETAKLTTSVNELRGDLKQELGKVARPADVETAIAPIQEKMTALESDVAGVVANEGDRKQNAQRIVLALQLANLKRAIDRGAGFAPELEDVKQLAGDKLNLGPLEDYKDQGVPTAQKLETEFRSMSHDLIAAETKDPNAGFLDQLLSGAQSVVRVRRTGESAEADPNSAEAVVAKMEQQLKAGDLSAAADTAGKLPEKAKVAADGFVKRLKARAAVDTAIAEVENTLKSSLAGEEPAAETKS
ncbi:MAG: hypothetical protein AAFQ45_11520 [Pseudomonadota bacterium]